jgi:bacterioferritin
MSKLSLIPTTDLSNNYNPSVIAGLRQSLTIHWQQAQTLTAQAQHFERWGYSKRAKITAEDAAQEVDHANIVLRRLEFFDVSLQYEVGPMRWERHNIVSIIKANLTSVQQAASNERSTIQAARASGDELTANIMIPLLEGSEAGIIQFQAELKMIETMGLDNFLTLQV